MTEQRVMARETTLERVIQTRVNLPDGISLTGTLKDLSASGAKILGDTGGLSVGDEFTMALLLPTESQLTMECQFTMALLLPQGSHVTYECRVVHVEPGTSFGVRFLQ